MTYPEFRIFETSKIVFKLKEKENVDIRSTLNCNILSFYETIYVLKSS